MPINKEQFDKSIEFLKQDISSLRTGRATPALVEDIVVEAYGSKQPLHTVASINVADARTLNISPWDKSLMQAVEEGIRKSDIGINPVNDGTVIRLPLPELTAERRNDLIKILHKKLEEAKIAIRKIREELRTDIDKQEKAKEISEDDKYNMQDDIEEMVKSYNEKIKQIGEEKEKEINTI
ncbi:MAG: ribosome recycling factor [Candidatus Magasanikbacteria bacterium]|nr:ribosome recycling factor [Candidatus Magasanikbacteria bacterium]